MTFMYYLLSQNRGDHIPPTLHKDLRSSARKRPGLWPQQEALFHEVWTCGKDNAKIEFHFLLP